MNLPVIFEGSPDIPPHMTIRDYKRFRAEERATQEKARRLAPVIAYIKRKMNY